MVKEEILKELEKNAGKPVSGQALADRYKVSRNAVWKAVGELKKAGYPIAAAGRKGYVLPPGTDVLTADGIRAWLDPAVIHAAEKQFLPGSATKGRTVRAALPDPDGLDTKPNGLRICVYASLDSTNLESHRLLLAGFSGPALIAAEQQTGGLAHSGGTFYSPAGSGLYMSLLLPLALSLDDIRFVSRLSAVAAARTLQSVPGHEIAIAKVNDLCDRKKKIGGIRCEAIATDLESGSVSCAVIGIGIRTRTPAPTPANQAESSLGGGITRNQLAAKITNELMRCLQEAPEEIEKSYRTMHL